MSSVIFEGTVLALTGKEIQCACVCYSNLNFLTEDIHITYIQYGLVSLSLLFFFFLRSYS